MRILILFSCCTFLFIACRPGSPSNNVTLTSTAALEPYISGYTQVLNSIHDSEIRIRLAATDQRITPLPDARQVIDISKRVQGEARWVEDTTISYLLSAPLDFDQKIPITLAIHKLFKDVPSDQKEVYLQAQTKPLYLNMKVGAVNYTKDDKAIISGEIYASDQIDTIAVRKMIDMPFNDGLVSWHHSDKIHAFTYAFPKKSQAEQLAIAWQDKTFNTGFKGSKLVTIAQKDYFDISDINTLRGSGTIEVHFTEPLASQNLDGLLMIENYTGPLTVSTDGSKAIIQAKSRLAGTQSVRIDPSLQSQSGRRLNKVKRFTITLDQIKPELRWVGKGVIVPTAEQVIIPFEVANLRTVNLSVSKIFQNNILYFLQDHTLQDPYGIEYLGREIHSQSIDLTQLQPASSTDVYDRYVLDLKSLVQLDKGAIYQVRLSFDQNSVLHWECPENYKDNWDSNNPCSPAYYRYGNSERIKNFLVSDFGVIAHFNHKNSGSIVVSDVKTASPIAGIKVEIYDYQKQMIASGNTDNQGIYKLSTLAQKPAFVLIQQQGYFGYLRLYDYDALPTSEFAVSGKALSGAMDAFIYAERGVWRPGDSIYLNVMLDLKGTNLPLDYPIQIELRDPKGKVRHQITTTRHMDHVYHIPLKTSENDPTGIWYADVIVGDHRFSKLLKVETIKPNRIKIVLDVKSQVSKDKSIPVDIDASWLHGAPAANLDGVVEAVIAPVTTKFDGYRNFKFDDVLLSKERVSLSPKAFKLDNQGEVQVSLPATPEFRPPGKVALQVKTRVNESSGYFSEDQGTYGLDIYSKYVGLSLPGKDQGYHFLESDKSHTFQAISVDHKGNPQRGVNLEWKLYVAEWNWWYDEGYQRNYNYNAMTTMQPLDKGKLTTDAQGKASFSLPFDGYEQYYLRVCDGVSGHCSSALFYTSRYWYERGSSEGPQLLTLSTDKASYNLEETIQLTIPGSTNAQLLVTISDQKGDVKHSWHAAKADQTTIPISTKNLAAGTHYISVHMLQPFENRENDMALRMYGVVPVTIEDPKTILLPKIDAPKEVKPLQEWTINVSEEKGQPMTYSLAIVDEGLLSLTRFETPDPHNHFYAKTAINTKCWDDYDDFVSGHGLTADQYISIGGDGDVTQLDRGTKPNRFPPVVRHLGVHRLKANGKNSHKVMLPNYMGSVKVIVVAKSNNSYGNADVYVPVRQDLMILSTMPRVLAPGESLVLPSQVFMTKSGAATVEVNTNISHGARLTGSGRGRLTFTQAGDQLFTTQAIVDANVRYVEVSTTASANGVTMSDKIQVPVRNPNPITIMTQEQVLEAQQIAIWTYSQLEPINDSITLEVSSTIPLNLTKHKQYLLGYPHGCLEQTVSKAFPQLYLDRLTALTSQEQRVRDHAIQSAIRKVESYMQQSGAIHYWPNGSYYHYYSHIYALHYLIEARSLGYAVPDQVIDKSAQYLSQRAQQIVESGYLASAYTCYVLAKAGKANTGLMNRLAQNKSLTPTASFLLAATYHLIGQKAIATKLLNSIQPEANDKEKGDETFWSEPRNESMRLIAMMEMGMEQPMIKASRSIAKALNSGQWFSTQTLGYTLMTIGKMSQGISDQLSFELTGGNGQKETFVLNQVIKRITLPLKEGQSIGIKNLSSDKSVYALVACNKQDAVGTYEPAFNEKLKLMVDYISPTGEVLAIDQLKQGTDLVAKITITNMDAYSRLSDLAILQIFPSGWEIRLDRQTPTDPTILYQDIRDDRVLTYLNLAPKQSSTFEVPLTASYAGRFYYPATYAASMYDPAYQSKTSAQWVEVSP